MSGFSSLAWGVFFSLCVRRVKLLEMDGIYRLGGFDKSIYILLLNLF